MTPVSLSVPDLGAAALLIVLDAALSLALGLGLHRQVTVAAARMVVQLVLVGLVLRTVFALGSPALTLAVVLAMVLIAAREVAARPERQLGRFGNLLVGAVVVSLATFLTTMLALTTALRPHPWWQPRAAIPLAGIILGNVLNAASLSLDSLLGGVARERAAIEARLALGEPFRDAIRPLVREAARRGLLPIVNQMSAAGLVTLPGIMTGQILGGMDPMQAVRYQILLMFLLAGGSGLAAAGVALFASRLLSDARQRLRLDRLAG
ncbi:MAG TPA: iron export ABC transporter permease subunit FetB [Acetobacteraceae bacterium]|nr:iron export ABC transporter permease subunit FetB [Acetobacteraceae bacterium]